LRQTLSLFFPYSDQSQGLPPPMNRCFLFGLPTLLPTYFFSASQPVLSYPLESVGVLGWLAFFTCPDPSLHSSGPYSGATPPTQCHPATSNATCPLQQVSSPCLLAHFLSTNTLFPVFFRITTSLVPPSQVCEYTTLAFYLSVS